MSNTDNNFDADTEQLDGEFDQPEQTEEAASEAAPKKSGGGGKFIVILLVLILGGGAGAAKMGLLPFAIPGLTPAKSAPQQTAATPPQPASAEMPAAAPAQPAASSNAVLPPAFGSTPASDTSPAAPQEAAKASKPESASASSLMPPAIGGGQLGVANIAPPSGRTGIENPMDAAPAEPAEKPAAISAPDTGADPFAKSPAQPATAAPTTPVTADPLAETTPAVATPTAEPVVTPVAVAPADDAKVEALEKRIDMLEQTIAELKAGMVKKSDLDSLKASMASEPAHARHEATVTSNESVPTAAATKVTHKKATAAHTAGGKSVSSRWVLKSAKPGMAWVAMPGSSEIKTVSVGDTLSPIGKITAVGKDASGSWVVSGTRGKINQ